jgi:UDP-2,4-diacetamido-2,4,6-trideoxy-beta-L-altropyranose hydrolase
MKVLFRTDSSVNIGSGHLMRCLTLADQLRSQGAEIIFVCRDLPGAMFEVVQNRGYRTAKLPFAELENIPQHGDAEETIKVIQEQFPDGADWLVVDHYGLDASWESELRPFTQKIMVIDDLADRQHDCDLLLDQNYYCNAEQRYTGVVPDTCITLLGPGHVLLRPEFIEARQRIRQRDGIVKRILVFFGGSDPTNQTQKVLESLPLLDKTDILFEVVVGDANPYRKSIQALCEKNPNVSFYCQVSNMAELIMSADLAIGAGGSAMWERCYLGLPTITVIFVGNQQRTTEDLAGIGAIEYLGWADQLTPDNYARAISKMIDNPKLTREIATASIGVLKLEGKSVAEMMRSLV